MSARLPLVALLLSAACGDAAAPERARPPALVRVGVVEDGDLTERWLALGDVRPLQSAELAAGAPGPVATVSVREGDAVAPGQVLLEVERSPAVARLRAAEAATREAQVERDRLATALERRQGVSTGVLAGEELRDAAAALAAQEARLAGAQAAEADARVTLHRHQVAAPFAGVVTARRVDPGDWVTTGQPVLSVVSTADVEVHVRVPERIARSLAPGAPVQLDGAAGTVAAVVPAVDPVTRTVLARLTPGPDARLLAGQAVDVHLPVAWRGVGVRVPRDALLVAPDQTRVLRLEGETVVAVPVEVLAQSDDAALVSGELSVGDQVVTRGNERARPGQPVRVEAPREGAAE